MTEDKPVFVTEDRHIGGPKEHPVDTAARTGAGGVIVLDSADQLMELARIAQSAFASISGRVAPKMTPERAARVRELRADGFTWRSVAAQIHAEWGADADWNPPSNQLAGMALCEAAATALGEEHAAYPWR